MVPSSGSGARGASTPARTAGPSLGAGAKDSIKENLLCGR